MLSCLTTERAKDRGRREPTDNRREKEGVDGWSGTFKGFVLPKKCKEGSVLCRK
jgi:hypothetical protein